MAQVPIKHVEIRGRGTSPSLLINGAPLEIGTRLQGSFGLDCAVDDRLLKIVALLALRRTARSEDGWVHPAELGALIDSPVSGTAVSKFLERRLLRYRGDRETIERVSLSALPDTHLIQYYPRQATKTGWVGGISRGPYRLGVDPSALKLDPDRCWEIVAGSPVLTPALTTPDRGADPRSILALAEDRFWAGDIAGARVLAAASVRRWHEHPFSPSSSKPDLVAFAWAWDYLANLDMELGRPNDAIKSASHAALLFQNAKLPAGIAHTWQIKAHAFGQLDDVPHAILAARSAFAHLSAARSARLGVSRSLYVGTLGQYLSRGAAHTIAEQKLLFAQRVNAEHGRPEWTAVWISRRAQNALRVGDITGAERLLSQAQELASRSAKLTIPMRAMFARISAEVMIAAQSWDEAARWSAAAHQIGVASAMSNQLRMVRPLVRALHEKRM